MFMICQSLMFDILLLATISGKFLGRHQRPDYYYFVSLKRECAVSLLESSAVLAEAEGLSAHAKALRIRLVK